MKEITEWIINGEKRQQRAETGRRERMTSQGKKGKKGVTKGRSPDEH